MGRNHHTGLDDYRDGGRRKLLSDNKALREHEEWLALRSTEPPAPLVERVKEMSEAQCTLAEIAGTLAVEFEITQKMSTWRVEQMAERIVAWAHAARARVRERLFRAACGKEELTQRDYSTIQMFGLQHLGFTTTGMDSKLRKAVEDKEKAIAHQIASADPFEMKDEDGKDTI